MSTDIQAILDERHQTHGDFTDNARVMQELKEVCRGAPNWGRLTPVQREGLDMIMHKAGRILSGNPDHLDHWDDIQGYARCVRERLPRPGRICQLRSFRMSQDTPCDRSCPEGWCYLAEEEGEKKP